jgi:hypothetical protein
MKHPAIVVDIDNTILDTSKRKAAAFMDSVLASNMIIDRKSLRNLQEVAKKSYDFKPLKDEFFKILLPSVFDRFLSDDYLFKEGLHSDDPVPGSVKFLSDALDNGCRIIYLTGRHSGTGLNRSGMKNTMVEGTINTLKYHGYPVPSRRENDPSARVTIIFKEDRFKNDVKYKKEAAEKLMKTEIITTVLDDRRTVLDMFRELIPQARRFAVLVYPDQQPVDYGCTGDDTGIDCMHDFNNISVNEMCNIKVDHLPRS